MNRYIICFSSANTELTKISERKHSTPSVAKYYRTGTVFKLCKRFI